MVVADTMVVLRWQKDSQPTGAHSAHSKRREGRVPVAEVSDFWQNEHWMDAQSVARQHRR